MAKKNFIPEAFSIFHNKPAKKEILILQSSSRIFLLFRNSVPDYKDLQQATPAFTPTIILDYLNDLSIKRKLNF